MNPYPLHKTSPSTVQLQAAQRRSEPPQLHFFEVWEAANGKTRTRTGVLQDEQVEDWLTLKGDFRVVSDDDGIVPEESLVLRLIGCDFHRHPFALGCGKATFEIIRKAFRLLKYSEEIIVNNNGAFGRYLMRGAAPGEIDSFALAFKVANCVNIGYDALSMAHDFKSRTTRAFVHGLLDSEMAYLISQLSAYTHRKVFEQPLLLPSHVYDEYRRKTEAHRILVDDSLHLTEVQIGYAIPGLLAGKPDRYFRDMKSRPENVAPETITRRLHSCSTELGTLTHAGNFGKELGLFLQKSGRELEDMSVAVGDSEAIRHSGDSFQKIEFALNLYTTLLSQVAVLKERVQNHTNLTFSLIAQDENRISRSMARESALVAVATKRDSTAMKTIALLTIIFLPPTFVATFFSMTMFDWAPQQSNESIVSKYLWVYWAVAIPLTAIVLFCWRIWLKWEDDKYQSDLKKVKEENTHGSAADLQFHMYEVTSTEKMREEFSQFQRHRDSGSAREAAWSEE